MRLLTLTAAVLIAAGPSAASAKLDLSSALGGALPGLGTTGVGNATGLLGYCVKNKLLGGVLATPTPTPTPVATPGSGAAGILGKLLKKPGVAQSPGYLLGQQGQVEQAGGGALPLDVLGPTLKAKACDVVLKRAGSFL